MTVPRTTHVATGTGAASHVTHDWHAINWHKVHRNVRRLQARIVQAQQAGKWGRVKALQHLLTHSFSGKTLAVRRVTETHGKRTPGVDGVTWNTPTQKATAVDTLRQRGYHPRPVRRVHIPKSNGKTRPLGILTMQDRAMQALYLLALDPIAETTADPNSYGFRKDRSPADAIGQCFVVLAKGQSPQWILEGDLCSCFDRISHTWLLAHIPIDKAMLQKWLTAGFMDNNILYPTEAGTPQGGPLSPALANLTLTGLEQVLRDHYPQNTRRSRRAQVNLVRFADDFIITGSSRELLEDEIKPLVEQFLCVRGLELSQEKTTITHIEDGFDFLGQNIRKYNGKMLIKPSRKNIQTFLAKVRALIKAQKQAPAGVLIAQLNPIIQGWAQYHRHVVSKRCFQTVDRAIFLALWHWARRRHPRKSKGWIRATYFQTRNGQQWKFFGQRAGRDGKPVTTWLRSARDVPIRRHVKIRGAANPYDPAWEVYFEERLGVKMSNNLRGRRQLLYLWKEQDGKCPVCNQKITELTGWHNHHVIWRTNGGADTADNRVLLHPNCHRQVHSQGVKVVKPRRAAGVGMA